MSTRSSAVLSPVSGAVRVALRSGITAPLVVSSAGGLLLAVAPVLSAARTEDGAVVSPGFPAGPLLAALALAPIALAWALAVRGRAGGTAAVLAVIGALAPARVLVDAQLIVQPWWAGRPELLVPTSLAPLRPGVGAWVLVLGHLLTAAGGVAAMLQARHVPARANQRTNQRASTDMPAVSTAGLCAGAVAAAGLVAAPFGSTDPYLPAQPAVDAPALVMVGTLLLAGGVALAGWLAAGALDADVAAGALLGTAAVVVAVALPPVAAALLSPTLSLSWGPLVALTGAAGLGWLSWSVGRDHAITPQARGSVARSQRDEPLQLPALGRLHTAAGVIAVASAVAGLVGAASSQVLVPARMAAPVIYPARLLVPAAGLLLALGVVLASVRFNELAARMAAWARPALGVGWAAMALAAASVLDASLAATQIAGVSAGPGAWATGLALLAAMAAGAVAGVAGAVDREEVDLSQPRADRTQLWLGVPGAVLALPAFGLPLLTAPGFSPTGLWSNFGVASWGLLAGLTAVATSAVLAAWSRASRALGLLAGALGVLAVHVAQLPLTGARAGADTSVAAGTWFSLGCAAVLLTGAWWAWQRGRRGRPAPQNTKYPAAGVKRPAARRRP